MKKVLWTLLAALLIVSLFSVAALADGEADPAADAGATTETKKDQHGPLEQSEPYVETVEGLEKNCTEPAGETYLDPIPTKEEETPKTHEETDPHEGNAPHAKYVRVTVQETNCTQNGWILYECTYPGCNWHHTVLLARDDHQYKEVVIKEPTCIEWGTKAMVCQVCGAVKEGSEVGIEPVGKFGTEEKYHNFGAWNFINAATCDQPGHEARICYWCGRTEYRDYPAAKGHTWKVGKPATCQDPGYKYCTVCGAQEELPIDPNNHNWSVTIIEKTPATCIKDGVGERHCERCGKVDSQFVIPAKGHLYATRIIYQPTEDSDGLKVYECIRCRDGYTDDDGNVMVPGYSYIYYERLPYVAPVVEPTTEPTTDPTDEPTTEPTTPDQTKHAARQNGALTIPATGDSATSLPYAMLAIAIVGLTALALSKRKVNG